MKPGAWFIPATGLLLVALALWGITSAAKGVQIVSIPSAQPPMTVFLPERAPAGSRPVVLIAHGFAGSGVVMRAFALTLAHAGYAAITWDFDGHGSNPRPLQSFARQDALLADAQAVLDEAVRRGLVSRDRVAILGHSMGSGVALTYGQDYPETAATIAISPVSTSVTPSLPRNLLLMAGTGEASFLDNAQKRLAEAGGAGGDPTLGTGRKLVPIPGANHITILFSPLAHHSARDWLDATFGVQPGAVPYTDVRMIWFAVGVAGTMLVAGALAWRASRSLSPGLPTRPAWQRLVALVAGGMVASIVLGLLRLAGVDITGAFGILVGGYLLIWFPIAGMTSLLALRLAPGGLSGRAVLAGLLSFVILWLGVGLLGNMVWQPWLLVFQRLVYWPLGALALLPWFLAVGELVRGAGWPGQAGGWLAHSVILIGALFLAMQLTPGIGFLILIMPVFPIFFALHALASAPYRGGWPFALSGALFTAWMLLAVFPLYTG